MQRAINPVTGNAGGLFLEIDIVDPSTLSQVLAVAGVEVDGHQVLRVDSAAAPHAIEAILLALGDAIGQLPQCGFEVAEGNPIGHLFRYLLGDTAPLSGRSSARWGHVG